MPSEVTSVFGQPEQVLWYLCVYLCIFQCEMALLLFDDGWLV
jgi:hypothetical protein